MGASISAIGVDVEYNERVMSVLALESNGRHHFVDDPSDLSRAFDDELASLVKSVAKDAEVAVDLAPGVELVQVVDRSFRREGDKLIVPLGAFSAGEEKTLLVKLRIPRGAEGSRPVADVRLGFADLSKGGAGSAWGKLATTLIGSDETPSDLDPIVRTRSERAETASVLREANDLFNQGRSGEAQRKLSARIATIRQGQQVALGAAPASRSGALKKDFDDQTLALDEAEKGFAAPATEAAPVAGTPAPGGGFSQAPRPTVPSRKNKAQVKENAARADAFAF
jgi:Ca-activated chloride channel family protein